MSSFWLIEEPMSGSITLYNATQIGKPSHAGQNILAPTASNTCKILNHFDFQLIQVALIYRISSPCKYS